MHTLLVSIPLYFSPSATPPLVLTAALPPPPRGTIHSEVEHSLKVKCQRACALPKILLRCERGRRCRCYHLAAALIASHPKNQWVLGCHCRCRRACVKAINRFQYGPAGICEWNSISFCKIVHLLDEQILMAVLANCSYPMHKDGPCLV